MNPRLIKGRPTIPAAKTRSIPGSGTETAVTLVVFGEKGIKRDDADWFPAFVLNHILGGGVFSSRLYQEIREKRGLAYSVYTYLDSLEGGGFIFGGAITIEYVFSWPGLGWLTVQAIEGKDYPLLQAMFLIFSGAVIVANLIAIPDVLPNVRPSGSVLTVALRGIRGIFADRIARGAYLVLAMVIAGERMLRPFLPLRIAEVAIGPTVAGIAEPLASPGIAGAVGLLTGLTALAGAIVSPLVATLLFPRLGYRRTATLTFLAGSAAALSIGFALSLPLLAVGVLMGRGVAYKNVICLGHLLDDKGQKMSKSKGNYIGITEEPNTMFAKVLSISDELMWRWFTLLSFKSMNEIDALKREVQNGRNPKEAKVMLAKEITSRFHGAPAAEAAERLQSRLEQNAD